MPHFEIEHRLANGELDRTATHASVECAFAMLDAWGAALEAGERVRCYKVDGEKRWRVVWQVTAYDPRSGLSAVREFDFRQEAYEGALWGLDLRGWSVRASVEMVLKREGER